MSVRPANWQAKQNGSHKKTPIKGFMLVSCWNPHCSLGSVRSANWQARSRKAPAVKSTKAVAIVFFIVACGFRGRQVGNR